MPAVCAHYYFNRRVLSQLDDDLQSLASRYLEEYLFGAQGPDLFFFNPFIAARSGLGSRIHRHSFKDYADRVDPNHLPPASQAYFYGTALHFILDSHLHPLVNALVDEKINHYQIETELDRYFIRQAGYDTSSFKQADLLPGRDISGSVFPVYQPYGVSQRQVHFTISSFRRLKRMIHIGSPAKERFLFGSMRILGLGSFRGVATPLEPHPEGERTTPPLLEAYEETLKKAPALMRQLYDSLQSGIALDGAFLTDFSGQIAEEGAGRGD